MRRWFGEKDFFFTENAQLHHRCLWLVLDRKGVKWEVTTRHQPEFRCGGFQAQQDPAEAASSQSTGPYSHAAVCRASKPTKKATGLEKRHVPSGWKEMMCAKTTKKHTCNVHQLQQVAQDWCNIPEVLGQFHIMTWPGLPTGGKPMVKHAWEIPTHILSGPNIPCDEFPTVVQILTHCY